MSGLIASRQLSMAVALAAAICFVICAQSKLPKPPPARNSESRITDVRARLDAMKPVDVTARRALAYGRLFLSRAESSLRSGDAFAAGRSLEAADALLHVAEHQQRLREGDGLREAARPSSDHLQRVYFRVQQADFFLQQSNDRDAKAFPKWARDFYQLAVRAAERKDWLASEENALSAEDVVRALESLAQATSPTPPITPRLPPPPARPEEQP